MCHAFTKKITHIHKQKDPEQEYGSTGIEPATHNAAVNRSTATPISYYELIGMYAAIIVSVEFST